MMRYPFLNSSKLLLVLSVSTLLLLMPSCSKHSCTSPDAMMAISNYDSTTGDTAATVDAYSPGNTFTSLRSTVETTIYQYGTQGIINYLFTNINYLDYIITLKPSNKQYRLSNRKYSKDASTGWLGQRKYCVTKFSYMLDGHNYYKEQTGFNSDPGRSPYYIISVE